MYRVFATIALVHTQVKPHRQIFVRHTLSNLRFDWLVAFENYYPKSFDLVEALVRRGLLPEVSSEPSASTGTLLGWFCLNTFS